MIIQKIHIFFLEFSYKNLETGKGYVQVNTYLTSILMMLCLYFMNFNSVE